MLNPIKWTGSKRGQAKQILEFFPKEINTYYEPFLGGGSVFLALLQSNIKVNKYYLSDINNDLINFWNEIKNNPDLIIKEYGFRWNNLKNSADRNGYYYSIRDSFNKTRNIHDFIFLNKTCFNGLIRYNPNGEFNVSFHFGRDGINPKKFEKIIAYHNNLFKDKNIIFNNNEYNLINPEKDDFCYFDPPYHNTKGIYNGGINKGNFWNFLRNLSCNYILSFDGKSGKDDFTFNVPTDVYNKHIYTNNAISGFKKMKKKQEYVQESLYLKI